MPTLLPEAAGLHLGRTLDSGQVFRWRWTASPDGGAVATGIVGSYVIRLAQNALGVWLLSPAIPEVRARLRRYLGVAAWDAGVVAGTPGMAARELGKRTDSGGVRGGLARIEAALEDDPVLARILPHTRGLSLLDQDPWEVLISFIVSQNNNIPKITQSIERLARAYGEPIEVPGPLAPDPLTLPGPNGQERVYAFPTPERLAAAHPRTLRACLLGYRAPYVRAAARMVAGGRLDLEALRRMPAEDARDALVRIPGVGEKVADCILLFGLGQISAFPVDVWVRRAVERLYFRNRPRMARQIQAFARSRFGALAGYAQQHLFTYARSFLRR